MKSRRIRSRSRPDGAGASRRHSRRGARTRAGHGPSPRPRHSASPPDTAPHSRQTGRSRPRWRCASGAFIGNGQGLWLRMQQAYDLWHATRKIQGIPRASDRDDQGACRGSRAHDDRGSETRRKGARVSGSTPTRRSSPSTPAPLRRRGPELRVPRCRGRAGLLAPGALLRCCSRSTDSTSPTRTSAATS